VELTLKNKTIEVLERIVKELEDDDTISYDLQAEIHRLFLMTKFNLGIDVYETFPFVEAIHGPIRYWEVA
jgi:hypothetical protein